MTPVPLHTSEATVIGAANGWGKRLADTLTEAGCTVHRVDIDTPQWQVDAALAASACICLAIPDDAIGDWLARHTGQLRGKCLIDCATNKNAFAETLKALANDGVSVCSTHPMAAADSALRGQNCLIMPLGRNSADAEAFARSLYRRLDMHLHGLAFTHHGELMLVVQMLPHLMQRLYLALLQQGLAPIGLAVGELTETASANYLLNELGIGRVASQRASVSAGILETGLNSERGRMLLEYLKQQVLLVQQNAGSREQLAAQFEQDVTALDPQGTWRTAMAEKTEAALNRLGNLRSRSLVLEAPNRIGMLRDILSVLADHGIDMTALDSQLLEGDRRVRFEIGIGSAEIDTASLTLDLTKHETEMLR